MSVLFNIFPSNKCKLNNVKLKTPKTNKKRCVNVKHPLMITPRTIQILVNIEQLKTSVTNQLDHLKYSIDFVLPRSDCKFS